MSADKKMDTVTVNAQALRAVLTALNGPGHHIRELQATRSLSKISGVEENPINILVDEFNAAVNAFNAGQKSS